VARRDFSNHTGLALKAPETKREAKRYLFENSADWSSVCASAGIDIGRQRTRLNMVWGRTLLDLLPIAA
jgi:hypothetical protein